MSERVELFRAGPTSMGFLDRPIGYVDFDTMLSSPFLVAHRGGGYDNHEFSRAAFDASVRRGYGALELSLARTSDGVWFGLHDEGLDRTSQVTGTIAANMTWAQVQGYRMTMPLPSGRTVPSEPYMRLEDILERYPEHLLFVDIKYQASRSTELAQMLASRMDVSRLVGKGFVDSTFWPDAVHAVGGKTWGYLYSGDLPNLPGWVGRWDVLGYDVSRPQSEWDEVLGYGLPVMAHVAQSVGDAETGLGKGAVGAMLSDTRALFDPARVGLWSRDRVEEAPDDGQSYVRRSRGWEDTHVDDRSALLRTAVWHVDAGSLTPDKSGLADLSGQGRDAVFGAGAAAPVVLPWDGEDYVHVPDANSNRLGAVGSAGGSTVAAVCVVTIHGTMAPRSTEDAGLFEVGSGALRQWWVRLNPDGLMRSAARDGALTLEYVSFSVTVDPATTWHRFTKNGLVVTYETSADGQSWQVADTVTHTGDRATVADHYVRAILAAPSHKQNAQGSLRSATVEMDGVRIVDVSASDVNTDYSALHNRGTFGDVPIDRADSGMKTAVVDRPLLLFEYGSDVMTATGFAPTAVGTILFARRYWESTQRSDSMLTSSAVTGVGGINITAAAGSRSHVIKTYATDGSANGNVTAVIEYGPNVLGVMSDGTSVFALLNGVSVDSDVLGPAPVFVNDILQVAYSTFAQDEFLSAVFFDTALTDEQVAQITQELQGIPHEAQPDPHPQYALETVVQWQQDPTVPSWAALPAVGEHIGQKILVDDYVNVGFLVAVWGLDPATGVAGWRVAPESDTGWRFQAVVWNPAGAVTWKDWLRRAGGTAHVAAHFTKVGTAAGPLGTLPVGFRNTKSPDLIYMPLMGFTEKAPVGLVSAHTNGNLQTDSTQMVDGRIYFINMTFETDTPWPTTLPGVGA